MKQSLVSSFALQQLKADSPSISAIRLETHTDKSITCNEPLQLKNSTLLEPEDLAEFTMKTLPVPITSVDTSRLNPQSLVKVVNINLHLMENGIAHRTFAYEGMRNATNNHLIVRRGQEFCLTLELSRHFVTDKDHLSLTFSVKDSPNPKIGNGTKVEIPIETIQSPRITPTVWKAHCDSISANGKHLKIVVTSAVNCIVNKWILAVNSQLNSAFHKYTFPGNIFILFNAWCKDDESYVESNECKYEYIENDSGFIYKGVEHCFDHYLWKFGQYEKQVLDCVFILVNNISKLRFTQCHSSLDIARALYHTVSNPLVFNMNETKWKNCNAEGSKSALQHFFRTGAHIKGRQTIITGVLVTAFRALGIAARPVTGFGILNGNEPPIIGDYFYSEKSAQNSKLNSDKISSYLVWAEVFLPRNDVGKEYSGWHYMDKRFGPTSVYAIKHRKFLKPYDTQFVFNSMNAEFVYWKYLGPDMPNKFIRKNDSRIGNTIVTRALGAQDPHDITDHYRLALKAKTFFKYKSLTGRSSAKGFEDETSESSYNTLYPSLNLFENVHNIYTGIGGREGQAYVNYLKNTNFNEILFIVYQEDNPNEMAVGSKFRLKTLLSNKNEKEDYTVSLLWQIWSNVFGIRKSTPLKTQKKTVKLAKMEDLTIDFELAYEEYIDKIEDIGILNFELQAHVQEPNFDYFFESDYRIKQPVLKIKVIGDLELYKRTFLDVKVKNPLPHLLKTVKFSLSELDCTKEVSAKATSIQPDQQITARFCIIPYFLGKYSLSVKMKGDRVCAVGYIEIPVLK